ASESREDLGCALRPKSTEAAYEAATVEVDVTASITLQVLVTTPGNISCLWVFKHSSLNCQPHFDLQNRGVVSMVILKMTETQAGEYLLFIQSEATNYTVLFTVSIRSKCRLLLGGGCGARVSSPQRCGAQGEPRLPLAEAVLHPPSQVNGLLRDTLLYTLRRPYFRKMENQDALVCISESIPEPTVEWVFCDSQSDSCKGESPAVITKEASVLHELFGTDIRCCARNELGRECTKLFTIEKGFINASKSSEDYEIDQYEEFCFSVRFKAYPQIRCTWSFSRKSFPCEQSGLDDGYSISKFCNHKHQPGQYIFHAENDDAQFTKTFTLNIRRKPQVLAEASASQASCSSDGYPLPSWTWKKCSDKSPNCTEEITEGIWNKKANRKVFGQWISSSTLNMSEAVKGFLVKCCAYNSLGTSCETILLNSPGRQQLLL
ncbi:hypothetical protein J1605_007229, partial [Eschrichtius robustus]